MYKCCWNCENGLPVCTPTKEQTRRFNASKRACCAPYPVSSHLEDPFKRRYCKQFGIRTIFQNTYPLICKEEAEMLSKMSVEELIAYWGKEG